MESKEFSELLKFVLGIPSGGAVLFLLTKAVISHWFKKNAEIEALKAQIQNKEVENLKEKITKLEGVLSGNIEKTEFLIATQVKVSEKINGSTANLHSLVNEFGKFTAKNTEILQDFSVITDKRLAQIEEFNNELKVKLRAAQSKSEQVKLSDNAVMIKKKDQV